MYSFENRHDGRENDLTFYSYKKNYNNNNNNWSRMNDFAEKTNREKFFFYYYGLLLAKLMRIGTNEISCLLDSGTSNLRLVVDDSSEKQHEPVH